MQIWQQKCNSNQIWSNNKCWCECKNPRKNVYKDVIFRILLHLVVKMVDMQKALLTIHWLGVMKLQKQQKVLWQKLLQQK